MQCFVRVAAEKEHIYTASNVPTSKTELPPCVCAAIKFFTSISPSTSSPSSPSHNLYRPRHGGKWIWKSRPSSAAASYRCWAITTLSDQFVPLVFNEPYLAALICYSLNSPCATRPGSSMSTSSARSTACRNFSPSRTFTPTTRRTPSRTTTSSSGTDRNSSWRRAQRGSSISTTTSSAATKWTLSLNAQIYLLLSAIRSPQRSATIKTGLNL